MLVPNTIHTISAIVRETQWLQSSRVHYSRGLSFLKILVLILSCAWQECGERYVTHEVSKTKRKEDAEEEHLFAAAGADISVPENNDDDEAKQVETDDEEEEFNGKEVDPDTEAQDFNVFCWTCYVLSSAVQRCSHCNKSFLV